MSQNALDIAKKNDGNRLFSFTYLYPIIMSIGKILCYIRVYSIHISQKTFNFAAEKDNNIKLWKKQRDALIVAKKLSQLRRNANIVGNG